MTVYLRQSLAVDVRLNPLEFVGVFSLAHALVHLVASLCRDVERFKQLLVVGVAWWRLLKDLEGLYRKNFNIDRSTCTGKF